MTDLLVIRFALPENETALSEIKTDLLEIKFALPENETDRTKKNKQVGLDFRKVNKFFV